MRPGKTGLNPNGRVAIPASFRRALGIAPGGGVVLQLHGAEVRLTPFRAALEEARKFVRAHVSRGESRVDELIAERKRKRGVSSAALDGVGVCAAYSGAAALRIGRSFISRPDVVRSLRDFGRNGCGAGR